MRLCKCDVCRGVQYIVVRATMHVRELTYYTYNQVR